MKTAISLLAASLLTLASAAQAYSQINPQTYSMFDWSRTNSWSWYSDQTYNGAVSGNWLSGGVGELTDGVKNTSAAYGYSAWSPYVLWDGYTPVITFDLGANYAVSGIQAYFNYYPSAAVYIPPSAGIRFSSDGVHYGATQLRTFSGAELVPGGNDAVPSYNLLTAAGSGRYVEVTLTSPNRWIALSEVEFFGSAATVPEPEIYAMLLAGIGLLGLYRVAQEASVTRRQSGGLLVETPGFRYASSGLPACQFQPA